ncbi:hypothetical protein PAAL109150_13835 [Paenibacillus alkaliterrae]
MKPSSVTGRSALCTTLSGKEAITFLPSFRYNVFIYIDQTKALSPLAVEPVKV